MLKKIIVVLIALYSGTYAMDNTIEPAIAARAHWIGNEIGFVIFRSIMNAHGQSKGILSDTDKKPLAEFDDTTQTVTTYFLHNNNQQKFILEQDKFITFLNDENLLEKAKAYKRLQRNLSIKCTIL
ncbi:MAG: hypothetical protein ACOYT8_05045 [Candidatus Dependentiae bacterium]